MDWFNGALATIFVLGIAVLVHEVGHFVAAKAFGVYAPRFSIGFGPSLIGKRWGETEYVLAALPLGGYVRMASREDESMAALEGGGEKAPEGAAVDPDLMPPFGTKPIPENRFVESKPAWARVIILLAGVTMNMILGFVVLTVLALHYGSFVVRTREVGALREVSSAPQLAKQLASQLSVGDTIVAIDGHPVNTWNDVVANLDTGSANPVTITTRRGQASVRVGPSPLPSRRALAFAIQPQLLPVVDQVVGGLPAARAGLQPGDSVVAVAGQPVRSWIQVVDLIEKSPGRALDFEVIRGGARTVLSIRPDSTPQSNPVTGKAEVVGKIGAQRRSGGERQPMALGEAVAVGWKATWSLAGSIVGIVKGLTTGAVSLKSLGGPIAIARASTEAAKSGYERVFELLAFLSINLAVFNLLPIPILDGGQILLVLAEAARGRAFQARTKEYILRAGLFAILGLFLLVMFNDVTGLFR